jgi:glucose/arabinose dehydrogenase
MRKETHGRTGCLLLGLAALAFAGCGGGDGGRRTLPDDDPPQPPPAGSIAIERVFPALGFTQPVAMLQAPGDTTRWFVVEKPGTIRVFDNNPGSNSSSIWLDLRASINAVSEGGLLGLAFDPGYATNRYIYVSYTAAGLFRSVVSRITVDADTGLPDPASESLILEVPQPEANHNGGNLAFGADGYLHIGFGDGGGAGDPFENGQDTTNVLGAILRIDVSSGLPYAIPPDNPFAGNTECIDGSGTAACPEIYAWGLRNPWRFTFDAQTGDLWVGDVGQNRREEINRVAGGENFGWDEREGTLCYEPPTGCSLMNTDPITEYDHSVGASVTGGYVYRGSVYPTLVGQYLFGDFVSGRIWRVPADADQGATPVELVNTGLSISSFAEANNGELYVVDFAGSLYRILVR